MESLPLVWLIPLRIMSSRFIHIVSACVRITFLLSGEIIIPLYVYTYHILFIPKSMDIWVVSTPWLL